LNKINKAFSRLEQSHEREPSPDELAEELEVSTDKVRDTMKVSGRHVSMDAPFVTGEENSLIDVLENQDSPKADKSLLNESLQKEIERSLSTLTEKERDVVKYFFGIGMNHGLTLEEIGTKFDLTRERVRQIKEKAIRRLRHTSRSKLLKAYLG
jgi:RNA polymerase primary sigma factor